MDSAASASAVAVAAVAADVAVAAFVAAAGVPGVVAVVVAGSVHGARGPQHGRFGLYVWECWRYLVGWLVGLRVGGLCDYLIGGLGRWELELDFHCLPPFVCGVWF